MEGNILTDEEIHAYVQYEAGNKAYFRLDDQTALAIKEKIDSSDLHRERYRESKKAYKEIEEALKSEKRPHLFLMVAASIVLIITVTYVILYRTSDVNAGYHERLADQQEENNPAKDNGLLAQNFVVNEELENYVNYPLRGSGGLKAVPETGLMINGKIQFNWQREEGEKQTLKIYNNKGKLVFEHLVLSLPHTLDQQLKAGLYYWSIENEDEIIHWSKFDLKKN